MNINRVRGVKNSFCGCGCFICCHFLLKRLNKTLDPILLGIISKGSEFGFKTGCKSWYTKMPVRDKIERRKKQSQECQYRLALCLCYIYTCLCYTVTKTNLPNQYHLKTYHTANRRIRKLEGKLINFFFNQTDIYHPENILFHVHYYSFWVWFVYHSLPPKKT